MPELYELSAARESEQRERMERLERAEICILCPGHDESLAREPELEGEHWYAVPNDFAYEGTSSHHLIVARRHVRAFDELPDEAGAELWALRRELKRRHGRIAEATVERSGAMTHNGGSIAHLHVHFVTLDRIPADAVRFRVSGRAGTTTNVGEQ